MARNKERLLAQYTQKKLLNEEKKMLIEKLAEDNKRRKKLKVIVEPREDIKERVLRRRQRDALNQQNLELETNTSSQDDNSTVKESHIESSEDECWDGFFEVAHEETKDPEPKENAIEKDSEVNPIDDFQGPAIFRHFERSKDIENIRTQLPILSQEHEIIEAIRANDISVIQGETGSGKTTQLPQMLLEHGFGDSRSPLFGGQIAITQPRRVAALAMSQRVAKELSPSNEKITNSESEFLVGHIVRYDVKACPSTSLVFMTDGILLRMIAEDFLLSTLSVVIIDEAHERSINTDLLLGLLTRIVALRRRRHTFSKSQSTSPNAKNQNKEEANGIDDEFLKKKSSVASQTKDGHWGNSPLKLVIMSATLQLMEISPRLFGGKIPPTISIPSRQYPISIHYSKITPSNPLEAAARTVVQINRKLPPGGILVFVTGQDEVWQLISLLQNNVRESLETIPEDEDTEENLHADPFEHDRSEAFPVFKIDDTAPQDTSLEIIEFSDSEEKNGALNNAKDALDTEKDEPKELYILPFYAQLPLAEQQKVIEGTDTNENKRLVVVSTNLAETSVTIPGISYVVDTGRVKRRYYDASSLLHYKVSWISKAAAQQRSGRAGRTGPGHAYRLYSAPLFEDMFEDTDAPEILHVPSEQMILQMRAMGISGDLRLFPFPTPPSPSSLQQGQRLLQRLNALSEQDASITALGRAMARLSLPVRYAKMVVEAVLLNDMDIVYATVSLVAVLASLPPLPQRLAGCWRLQVKEPLSDLIIYLDIFKQYLSSGNRSSFCKNYSLNEKAMAEAVRLRHQLLSVLTHFFNINISSSGKELMYYTKQLQDIIRLFVLAHSDCIARRMYVQEKGMMYLPAFFSSEGEVAFLQKEDGLLRTAYPNTSSLFSLKKYQSRKDIDWIVFGTLQEHQPANSGRAGKLSLSIISEIKDEKAIPADIRKLFRQRNLSDRITL